MKLFPAIDITILLITLVIQGVTGYLLWKQR